MANNIKKVGCYFSPKILPLVYDDSLSYYETNCKLVAKINELTDVINEGLASAIREQLDKLFVNAMYDAETETLILVLGMEE